MKRTTLALILLLPLGLSAVEVQTGDSLAEVRAALGAPRGEAKVGGRHLLYYDRGEVELQAGAVTRVALLSSSDLAALEARRTAEAARIRDDLEIRRTRLISEGEALKARKMADTNLRNAPPAVQVAFWQNFSRRYPDVPSAELLATARLQQAVWESNRARTEEAARLAELEARMDAADEQTGDAPGRVYVTYRRSSYRRGHSSDIWPIEYHFANTVVQPVAATVHYPAWGTTPFDRRNRTNVEQGSQTGDPRQRSQSAGRRDYHLGSRRDRS